MAFFGHFWANNAVFFADGGSETLDNLLQKIAKQILFDSSTLKIRWGALQLPAQAPKTLFWEKMAFFLAILDQKMRSFGDGGSKTIDNLLQNLARELGP